MNLPYEDRLCTKRSSAVIGDIFHYVFSCPFFGAESRKNIFHHFIVKMQMLIYFTVFFCSKKKQLLVNLTHFLKFIMSEF